MKCVTREKEATEAWREAKHTREVILGQKQEPGGDLQPIPGFPLIGPHPH